MTCLDCEVDTQTINKDGQKGTLAVQIGKELSRHQDLDDERCRQLAQLWSRWESTQADINELTNKLHDLLGRDPSKVTSGMSSNCEWVEKDDLDIDCRSKQVVEDMMACEEVSPSPNPDPIGSGSLKS